MIKNVFLIAGLYDLLPLLQTAINDPLKLDERTALELSPLRKKIHGGNTTFFVVVAEHDSPPFIKQGEQLKNHLIEAGVDTKYVPLKNVDHFNIMERLWDENFELTQLIIGNINSS